MPGPVTQAPPVVSIDVEDWAQSTWDRSLPISTRAVENTHRLLRLLDDCGVKTTMFVLGKLAEAFPELVREIRAAGHEIACHGFGHVEIFKQSPEQFRADVRRAKEVLEDVTGERVIGYRAPDFSVVRSTLWALEILAELGFIYDSSIFPIQHKRYGIPEWPRQPIRVELPTGRSICEMPIGSLRFLGKTLPVGGGGYHRLLPGAVSRLATRRAMRDGVFVFYCHPYEIDAQEMLDNDLGLPLSIRLHQGLGRGRYAERVRRWLGEFGGRPMREAVASDVSASAQLSALVPSATAAA